MTQPDPTIAALVAAITPAVVEQYPQLADTGIVATDLVTSVLTLSAAAKDVVGGDPEGMIRKSDAGDFATRVVEGGLPMWRINPADGSPMRYDMEPTLDWPVMYNPAG